MCPAYIAGLIGPGDRKSLQPIAAKADDVSYDRLHHFIGAGIWECAARSGALATSRCVGRQRRKLAYNGAAEEGENSVGVAPQYASALGRNANCQTMVSVTLARGEVPVMLCLRLFLPESWTSHPARMIRASVPDAHRAQRPSPRSRLRRSSRVHIAACGSAACSRMPGMA